MKKNKCILVIILSLINLQCGLLHFAFEYFLLSNNSIYRELLLIENILIGLVFICFAYYLFFGELKEQVLVLKMSLSFWMIFILTVTTFSPQVTTLNMIKTFIPVPQHHVLFIFGFISFILSATLLKKLTDKDMPMVIGDA